MMNDRDNGCETAENHPEPLNRKHLFERRYKENNQKQQKTRNGEDNSPTKKKSTSYEERQGPVSILAEG